MRKETGRHLFPSTIIAVPAGTDDIYFISGKNEEGDTSGPSALDVLENNIELGSAKEAFIKAGGVYVCEMSVVFYKCVGMEQNEYEMMIEFKNVFQIQLTQIDR